MVVLAGTDVATLTSPLSKCSAETIGADGAYCNLHVYARLLEMKLSYDPVFPRRARGFTSMLLSEHRFKIKPAPILNFQ